MKLARPDIFHPSIVLASCERLPDGDGDDRGLVTALRRRGLHARWLPWDDPETENADLVILRAAWDYVGRREEFLAWTTRVRNLLNAPAAVAWNRGDQTDCHFHYYKNVDYNCNRTRDGRLWLNCEGGYTNDYLHSCCGANGSRTSDRGTEGDWLKFWWDLHTNYGYSFGKITNIWDYAQPHSWDPNSASGSSAPYRRLRDSALDEENETIRISYKGPDWGLWHCTYRY